MRKMKTKEKVFTQIQPVFLPRFSAQIPKGSAMAQFWVLLRYSNITGDPGGGYGTKLP